MSFKTKTFEVRDRNTFIPCIGIKVFGQHSLIGPNDPSEKDLYLARRAGYGEAMILFMRLYGSFKAYYDPYDWGDRTMKTAHSYIQKNWKDLESGSVIDVEFILGETKSPKISERLGNV